jgi:hypothetical protein
VTVPRALLAVDVGVATTAVAIVGRPAGRWRLLGALAAPSPASPDDLAAVLAGRIQAVDPELATAVGLRPMRSTTCPASRPGPSHRGPSPS